MKQAIEQPLKQAESKQLEFKRDLSSLKTFTAFANTAGGILSTQFILSTMGSSHAITH